jgi:hypothetical protein
MRRIITLFTIAAMAGFAFTAIAAAAALAEATKILPEPAAGAANELEDVSLSGAIRLLAVGGFEIKCKISTGKERWQSANNGTFELTLKECTGPLATICTSTAQPEGLILVKGEVRFWLALEMLTGGGSALISALVFLITPAVTFTCVNKAKTIKEEAVEQANNCIAAKDLNLNSLVTTVKEEFTEWTSGNTLILTVLPAGSTSEISCLPTISLNGGAAELRSN